MAKDRKKDKGETLPAPPGNVRRIEKDGHQWVIREVSAPTFDRRGGTHLMFDAEIVMRRVRTFPANWHELPDDELYALTRHIVTPE